METNGIVLGVQGHDKVGEHFLSQLGVPAAITDFVRGHVQAKRYLTYKDPTYYESTCCQRVGYQNSFLVCFH